MSKHNRKSQLYLLTCVLLMVVIGADIGLLVHISNSFKTVPIPGFWYLVGFYSAILCVVQLIQVVDWLQDWKLRYRWAGPCICSVVAGLGLGAIIVEAHAVAGTPSLYATPFIIMGTVTGGVVGLVLAIPIEVMRVVWEKCRSINKPQDPQP